MSSSAIRHGAKYAAIVVLAALMILLAHLVTGAGNKGHGPSLQSDERTAEVSAVSAVEAKDATRPETPIHAASASLPPTVSPVAIPARPRLAKARQATPPPSIAATPASADQQRAEHWEFIESFAPQMPDHAEALAPTESQALAPETARTAAEPPAAPAIATTIALTPAVAVAPAAVQHDAVQLDDTPPPSTTAPPEQVSDVPALSDEQLSGVGAASKDVAGSIESDLPGV